MTVHIDGQILIGRPIGEVFDFVADQRNEPAYNRKMTSVEKLTDGPIGVGTRYRAVMIDARRTTDMVITITAFDRPHMLGSTSILDSMTIRGTLHFDAQGAATRLGWCWDIEPRGLLRLLTPIVAPLGRRQEREIWTAL